MNKIYLLVAAVAIPVVGFFTYQYNQQTDADTEIEKANASLNGEQISDVSDDAGSDADASDAGEQGSSGVAGSDEATDSSQNSNDAGSQKVAALVSGSESAESAERVAEAMAQLEQHKQDSASEIAEIREASAAELEKARKQRAIEVERVAQEKADELEKTKSEHTAVLEKLKNEHSIALERIKSKHSTDLEMLKSEYAAALENIKSESAAEIEKANSEGAAELERVMNENAAEAVKREEENKAELARIKNESEAEMARLRNENVDALASTKDQVGQSLKEQTVEFGEMIDQLLDASGLDMATMKGQSISDKVETLKTSLFETGQNVVSIKAEHDQQLEQLESKYRQELQRYIENNKSTMLSVQQSKEQQGKLEDAIENLKVDMDSKLTKKDGLIEELRNSIRMLELGTDLAFRFGSVVPSAKGKELLLKVTELINDYPDYQVSLEGHTDNVRIRESRLEKFPSNWELSAARASSAARFLVANGVDPSRLRVVGLGPYRPIDTNDTEEGRARNRRLEILFTPSGLVRQKIEDL